MSQTGGLQQARSPKAESRKIDQTPISQPSNDKISSMSLKLDKLATTESAFKKKGNISLGLGLKKPSQLGASGSGALHSVGKGIQNNPFLKKSVNLGETERSEGGNLQALLQRFEN